MENTVKEILYVSGINEKGTNVQGKFVMQGATLQRIVQVQYHLYRKQAYWENQVQKLEK
jgi:hypothetical protein